MAEVRTMREGSLWWVQASGSGTTWATATSPASGLVGYVTDFSFKSAQTTVQVMDRGAPTHHKVTEKSPIEVSFSFLWTGYDPYASGLLSASGASVQIAHLEHRASAAELGAGTGRYHQFHGAILNDRSFTEAGEGNNIAMTVMALAMNGPTASGYIT